MRPLPRRTHILRRVLLGAAIAATVVAAAVVEENIRGERAWRAFRRERADAGFPLDFAFYGPPQVPDDQNLLRAPVLARFFNPDDGDGTAWSDYSSKNKIPWDPKGPERKNQTGLDWEKGQFSSIGSANHTFTNRKEEARAYLSTLQPIKEDLDALGAAAQWRPRSQIPFLADGRLVQGSFAVFRTYSFVLCWRASAELELGQNDAAFADAYAALRLAEACGEYPTMIHEMVFNVQIWRAVQPIWEGWIKGAWTNEQLRRFQTAITPLHTYLAIGIRIAGTEAAVADEDEKAWPGPWWAPTGWRKRAAILIVRAGSGRDMLDLDAHHRPLTYSDLCRIYSPPDRSIETFPYRFFSFEGVPAPDAYPSVMYGLAMGQTAYHLVQIACGLQRYQRATGHYPTDLGTLIPDYLAEVPFDFMDGNRLRYHPNPDGTFALYSVGANGHDDLGVPSSLNGAPAYWGERKADGDWVWPTRVVASTRP